MERMTKIDENIQTAQNLLSGIIERCYELEEENRKLKEELAHYKNTEAIQKSNNASRYNPYNHKSYVDREFNVIN